MEDVLRFLIVANRLKKVPRLGWALRGVATPESVAEHTAGVGFVALALAEEISEPVDRGRLLTIALIHDLAEAVLGDIPTPAKRYFPVGAKEQAEAAVLRDVLAGLPSSDEWLALWHEYEHRSSVEGRLVRDADRLEMLLQAYQYEEAGQRGLDEFWDGMPEARWEFPVTAELFRSLWARRVTLGLGGNKTAHG